MYPHKSTFTNRGEAEMYDAFFSFLPDSCICYHNRTLGILEFDYAVLIPGYGIVVIEVKGYKAEDIKNVKNDYIHLKSGKALHSPFKQADKYRYAFTSIIKNEIDKDIPVFPIACYPFIDEEGYLQTELNLLSNRDQTILSNDLSNSLYNKLTNFISSARKATGKQFSELTLNTTQRIRKLFEPEESVDAETQVSLSNEKVQRQYYSYLTCFAYTEWDSSAVKAANQLLAYWVSGVKLNIVCSNNDIADQLVIHFNRYIKTLDTISFERFSMYDKKGNLKHNTFQLEIYVLPEDMLIETSIIDGENENSAFLDKLDQYTNFNFAQYKLEHANIQEDIMVTAGAGTGKTTCMISRINYLIYKHKYTSDTLPEALYMLTFTNDAASNMKKRLQTYFQDYFLLTLDQEALKLSECIENMQICTIHALSKKILERYSVLLGLGKDLSIVSGKHEKDRIVGEVLNEYIEKNYNEDADRAIPMAMYELQNRISEIMTKLQNKNIDIVNDDLNFGKSDNIVFHEMITSIPIEAEKRIREHFDSLSSVRLSDLMIKLKELVSIYGHALKGEQNQIEYLFVDEFQDTDDVQINLMKQFREVFGFHFFVVGDVKQCIYRFRGADEKAFDTLAPIKDHWLLFSLRKNYRTDLNLLSAYDKRFSLWGKYNLLDYKETDVLVGIKDFGNYGDEISYYYKDNTWQTSAKKDARFVVVLKRLMEEVRGTGEQAAILVRENWQINKIKQLCKKHDIYIETDVGGDLYELQPAIDLYKLVKALQHYKDPKYLFNLYTTYYVDEPMPKESMMERKQFTEGLLGLFNTKLTPIPKWREYVEALKYEPTLKVLREIVLDLTPWSNYASKEKFPEYSHKLESFYHHNLDEIFEKLAFEFNSDYLTISKVEKFLEIMILTKQQEQSRETLVEESESSVICSTIHKAKGLEFYSVVLPYMSTALGSTRYKGTTDLIVMGHDIGYSFIGHDYKTTYENNIYGSFKRNEAGYRRDEEARILYVAMTRAKKRFVFFDDNKASGTVEEPKNWQALLRGDS